MATTSPLTLAVVSAGLSQPSSTRLLADRLAAATSAHLAEAGREVQVQRHELRPLATLISHHLLSGFPAPALAQALEQVSGADALIAVSPVFSASYSGLFKSFFDLFEPGALAGKPVLIAATGGTARHSLALEHALRPLFAYQRALLAPTAVFAASEDWGGTGDALTDTLPVRIERAGAELAALAVAAASAPLSAAPALPFAPPPAALSPH
ncbi:CE1759 family FMN reductase [Saccharothrix sp. ST-888]|uniref:CE1759 family FMN reductase n=1 Tax=Saccharothrix sp. ST-888 TaxID=1427391 RepID=UPI0005ECF2C1|nr:CE1759 family FMN reductase [Saccharothrix sp. ST-888]KJK59122.1 oxidoreductase [Saccharothrix sp. ST-888]